MGDGTLAPKCVLVPSSPASPFWPRWSWVSRELSGLHDPAGPGQRVPASLGRVRAKLGLGRGSRSRPSSLPHSSWLPHGSLAPREPCMCIWAWEQSTRCTQVLAGQGD